MAKEEAYRADNENKLIAGVAMLSICTLQKKRITKIIIFGKGDTKVFISGDFHRGTYFDVEISADAPHKKARRIKYLLERLLNEGVPFIALCRTNMIKWRI